MARLLRVWLGCAVLALGAVPAAALEAQPLPWESKVCAMVTAAAEPAMGIPSQLMAAIARAESGRWDAARHASFAWPWTVTAEGQGHYYATKAQAVEAVRKLHARHITNIDVGCMQVNLHYHPRAFPSIEAALDPMKNAIYAGQFLKSLYEQQGSWTKAAERYHSPEFHARNHYVVKIGHLWFDEYRRAEGAATPAEAPAAAD